MKATASVKMVLDTRYKKVNAETFPVRLRVTHNRQQKYYPTKYSFTEKQWNSMNQNRANALKEDLLDIRDEEKKAVKIIEKMSVFSFEAFKNKLDNYSGTNTLQGSFATYSKYLRGAGQIGTADNYDCAIESLMKFRGKETLLNDINVEYLTEYEKWMKEKGRSTTTISMYLRCVRTILNKAIAEGTYTKEYYPFGRYKYEIPQSENKKRALSLSEIEKIYHYNTTGTTEMARDFWILIYFCNGINVKDLCLLKNNNIGSEKIVYQRSKTERTKRKTVKIEIHLNDDSRRIIKKYSAKGKPDSFVFPILKPGLTPERQKRVIQQFIHLVNDHMKKIASELGLDKPVTTYYARHSFATVMKRSGASTEMISELLGHSDLKTTKNYLDSFEDEMVKEKLAALSAFKKLKAV